MEIDKYLTHLKLGAGMKSGVTPQLLVLLLVLLVVSEAASVHAVTTFVDQQCRTGDGSYLAGIGGYKPVGQTFTPTETDVVIFAVNIYSTNNGNTTMTATILSGGIGGAIIASQSFLIPIGFGLSTKGDWFNVTFDKGVMVIPGQTYAFELSDNLGSTGINWNKCSTSYSGGRGYSFGLPLLNDADFMFMEFSGTFTIEVTPGTLSLAPGHSGSSLVQVTSFGGFDAPVNLTVGSVPSGVTVRLDSNTVTPPADGSTTTTLSIFVTVNATAGKYSITITGISGSQHPSSTLALAVTAPGDFTISANPNAIILSQGASSACTISVESINGFNSTVSFTGSWLTPSPVGLSFVPPHPITPSPGTNASSQLVLVGNLDASTGSFKLRITGTTGSISHTINVTVQVQVATISSTTINRTSSSSTLTTDFSIMLPSTMSLSQGTTAAVQVSVTSIDGFDSSVSLSYSWMTTAPSGVSIDLPGPITPSPEVAATSTLTVSTSPGSSTGTFTLIVTGASGSLSHSANVNIMISASAGPTSGLPKCVIATATYGSELSPEVVILRSFRDSYIQRTKAGSSFMIVFNAWYYSFSPYVAEYLTAHPMSRMLMKGVLYPLVGVLLLTSNLFTVSPTISEAGILLAGLFASCLIGAIYVGLPLGFVQAKFRLRRKSVGTRLLFATLVTSIAGLIIGEGLASSMLMISTPLIVISTMLLSGMFVSSAITTVHGKFSNQKGASP